METLTDSFAALSPPSLPSHPSSPLSIPRSISPYVSEDEVVWCLSGSNVSFSAHDSETGKLSHDDNDDGDFVLLDKPRSSRRWSDADLSDSQNEPRSAAATSEQSSVPREASLIREDAHDKTKLQSSIPIDRVASATPVPTPGRRLEAAEAATLPPTVDAPVPASTQDLERIAHKKAARKHKRKAARKHKKELKKLQKKEAKAAVASAAPDDTERTKKKRAARRCRRERKRQREQADPAVKPAPKKVRPTVVTETTPPELYQEASNFISSCVSLIRYFGNLNFQVGSLRILSPSAIRFVA